MNQFFFVSLLESGFEFSINQIIKKVVEPKINKLNCIIKNLNELSNVINDNRIIEINNKLLLITNNILEYLQLTKECLYEIGLNSTGRFLSSCFSFDLRINKDKAIAAYLTWF